MRLLILFTSEYVISAKCVQQLETTTTNVYISESVLISPKRFMDVTSVNLFTSIILGICCSFHISQTFLYINIFFQMTSPCSTPSTLSTLSCFNFNVPPPVPGKTQVRTKHEMMAVYYYILSF